MMTTGRQSKKVTKTSFDEGGAKVGEESVPKVEDVIDAILTPSRALRTKAGSAFQVLKIAFRAYGSVNYTSFSETVTGSALHRNLNLVLASPPFSTRSAPGQVSFSHDVLRKVDINDDVRLMSSLMAPKAHGPRFLFVHNDFH